MITAEFEVTEFKSNPPKDNEFVCFEIHKDCVVIGTEQFNTEISIEDAKVLAKLINL